MPIVAVGAILVMLFSGMLAFCLLTGLPCPIDGFDDSAYGSEGTAFRYALTSSFVTIALAFVALFAYTYVKRDWDRPGIATVVTILFVFMLAMLWGIASSGHPADRQLLIFASIEFLVAGLIVFDPIVSLLYFTGVFFVFGMALDLSGLLTDAIAKDLVYLALLDTAVCWVVYGLFSRANEREQGLVVQSQRDELTGARNRLCLRKDFTSHLNTDISVMLCDIDDFKQYNDNYDHSLGDQMLVRFYRALRDAFGDECVYRFGGDEFLVVTTELENDEFRRCVCKVEEGLSALAFDGNVFNLKFSGGFVRGVPVDNVAFRDMLHQADENLLQAKREGKDRVVGV